jgi:hypothetical protein
MGPKRGVPGGLKKFLKSYLRTVDAFQHINKDINFDVDRFPGRSSRRGGSTVHLQRHNLIPCRRCCAEPCPGLHEKTAFFEEIATPIRGLDFVGR